MCVLHFGELSLCMTFVCRLLIYVLKLITLTDVIILVQYNRQISGFIKIYLK
jgi:hypothetical protein